MEGGVDLISCLPEDILQQIVSLIPRKEATRTAVLSNTWRNLWSPFHLNLQLLDSLQSKQRLTLIFTHLLKSYEYPEKLQISFQTRKYPHNKFLAIITKGTHNNLHFDFSPSKTTNCSFDFVLHQMGSLNFNCPEFSSLKNLHLSLVPAGAETVMSDLFTKFHFLKSLNLEKCIELKNIDLRANGCLTSFTILDCCNIQNITFSAPKLTRFLYRGHLPDIHSVNAPGLTEVTLNLRDGLGVDDAFECEDVLCLLSCFKHVETLAISGWLLENDPKCMNIKLSTPYFHTYWHDHHLWMDCATVKRKASSLKLLKEIELLNFTCKEEDEVLFMDLLLHKTTNLKTMKVISPNMDAWKVNVIPSGQLCYQTKGCLSYMLVPSPYGNKSLYLFTETKNTIMKNLI